MGGLAGGEGRAESLDADGDGLPGHFISDDSLHLLYPLATVTRSGLSVLAAGGEPLLFLEKGGKGILRLAPGTDGAELTRLLSAFVEAAERGTIPPLKIERFDGEPLIGSDFEPLLLAAGFSRQPRKMVVPG